MTDANRPAWAEHPTSVTVEELRDRYRAGETIDLYRKRRVDATILRQLLTDREAPPGAWLDLKSAVISGDLLLKGCEDLPLISITDCVWEGKLDISFASLNSLWVEETRVRFIDGTRCRVKGSVYLRKGFESAAGVNLSGAFIGGTLSLRGAILRAGVTPKSGGPRKSIIDGDLQLAALKERREEYALRLVDARIAGRLLLVDPEDKSNFAVLLGSAELRGLDVSEFCDSEEVYAELKHSHEVPHSARTTKRWRDKTNGEEPAVPAEPDPKAWSLEAARVGTLAGLALTERERTLLTFSRLSLGGFTYRRISVEAPTEPAFRIDWLRGFRPASDKEELRAFRTQPYTQLARALRELGLESAAKSILEELHKRRFLRRRLDLEDRFPRPAVRIDATTSAKGVAEMAEKYLAFWGVNAFLEARRLLHGLWGAIAGFGFRPARMHLLAAFLVLATSCVVEVRWDAGDFAPAEDGILMSSWWASCSGQAKIPDCLYGAEATRLPKTGSLAYPAVRPLAYSLDVFLPMVDLDQERFWTPVEKSNWSARFFWYLLSLKLLGWIYASISLASLFTSLTKRGED